MSRRRTLLLALVLLAAGLWLILAETGPGSGMLDGGEDAPESEPPPGLLSSAPAEGDAANPGLAGRGADAHAASRRGPVRVRVVGLDGAPVAGAYILPSDTGTGRLHTGRRTDDAGVVVFPDVPYDGSLWLHFYGRDPHRHTEDDPDPYAATVRALSPAPGEERNRPVTGPVLVYRARTALTLEVHVVDAERGRPLEGAQLRAVDISGRKGPVVDAPGPIRSLIRAGMSYSRLFLLEPLDGYVQWDAVGGFTILSPYALRLTCRQPLRKELDVSIAAVDGESRPVAATVQSVHIGKRALGTWKASTDAYERLRLRGVPHLRGELLVVEVRPTTDLEEGGGTSVAARIPDDPDQCIDLQVLVLPDVAIEDHDESSFGVGGSRLRGRPGVRGNTYTNEVVVRVRRRGGGPAIGALVKVGGKEAKTDASGLARVGDLVPGEHAVLVHQAGLLPIAGTVRVGVDGTARSELREGAGGTIHLEVVDPEGAPLSFAGFGLETPSKLPWLDMDGDTQRLDMLVDHVGRRTLRHVEPGRVRLRAEWSSRRASREIDVVEGGETTIRLELPPPARRR